MPNTATQALQLGTEGCSQAIDASQSKVCRRYLECQTMYEIEEHCGLAEHIKDAVIANAYMQLSVLNNARHRNRMPSSRE